MLFTALVISGSRPLVCYRLFLLLLILVSKSLFYSFLLFSYEGNCNWLRELFKECFSSSEFTPLWLQAAVEQWKESKHFGLYCNNYHFKM